MISLPLFNIKVEEIYSSWLFSSLPHSPTDYKRMTFKCFFLFYLDFGQSALWPNSVLHSIILMGKIIVIVMFTNMVNTNKSFTFLVYLLIQLSRSRPKQNALSILVILRTNVIKCSHEWPFNGGVKNVAILAQLDQLKQFSINRPKRTILKLFGEAENSSLEPYLHFLFQLFSNLTKTK